MTLLLLFLNLAFAASHSHHLPDLEAPSWQYNERASLFNFTDLTPEPWEGILTVGPRNLQWLQILNAQLPTGQKINLYPPRPSKGVPLDQPFRYNDSVLNTLWDNLNLMPSSLKMVLFGNQPLPSTLPVDLEIYKSWVLKADQLYSLALRWRMVEENREFFRMRKVEDVRGLYHIKKMQEQGGSAEFLQLREWVSAVCMNATANMEVCQAEVAGLSEESELINVYARYKALAEQFYDSFFSIQSPRTDVKRSGNSLVMPFKTHSQEEINGFVESNIEDEFKWTGGFLNLTIAPTGTVNLRFEPAVTPYVDRLGGDNIVMNSDVPLDTWHAQYTIRHEFGHALGFPDCYVEFWDETEASMISYQLDVTNLMCSLAGRFNSVNEAALKQAYGF